MGAISQSGQHNKNKLKFCNLQKRNLF